MKHPYGELIGCLMYLVIGTRPDLSFAINLLSRYQDYTNDNHCNRLKHILRYLKSTARLGLYDMKKILGVQEYKVIGHSDFDWASDCNDRNSVSRICHCRCRICCSECTCVRSNMLQGLVCQGNRNQKFKCYMFILKVGTQVLSVS